MKNLKIYAYHRVTPESRGSLSVTVGDFEKQISYLLGRGYRNISLSELYYGYIEPGKTLEKKIFIITFDDGYADNYLYAFPVLKKYNLTATIFLTVDYISRNKPFHWDSSRFESFCEPDWAMTWDNVLEMQAAGIEFGSHTLMHPLLAKISLDQARTEIFESKVKLQDKLGKEVISFCYPEGSLNQQICDCVEQAGYKIAVVTPPRRGIKETRFTMKRIGIYNGDSFFKFKLKSNKVFYSLRERFKKSI